MWDLSCRDWETRIRAGLSLVPKLPLNDADVKRTVGIFDKLRLPDVPDQPRMAEAAGEWFREIIAALLGSIDPVTGWRMVRELFLLVAKKNSKTTNGAALMMTALIDNRRPRADFLLTGPTKEVADLAFSQAVGMIEADDEGFLKKRMHVQENVKTITDLKTKAKLKIKAFDSSVLTGGKLAGALIDELHEIAKIPGAARIIGQIRGGMMPIPEAFLAFITTQSDEVPRGAFKAELQVARAIRDGRARGAMLPVLYEFPDEIASDQTLWADSSNWRMVLPNVGRSVHVPRLVEDYETALLKGPDEVARFASQHLNIEIGLGLKSDRWAGAEFWLGCEDEELTFEALLKRSEVVVLGIDGGGLDDLLGFTALGRERGTRRWLSWSKAWAHEIVLERRKQEASRLRDFDEAGELVIVKTPGADVEEVADLVMEADASGVLAEKQCIGVDSVGITDVVDALTGRNFAFERIIGIQQGWKLSGAIKTCERKLAGADMVHARSGLMNWCVSNARAEARGNAVLITKQAAGSAKIDPLIALFNAVVLMGTNPQAPGRSVYTAERGLITV